MPIPCTTSSLSSTARRVFPFGLAAALAACGGGGGGSGTPAVSQTPPTVTDASLSSATPRFSDTLVLTVQGTHLDSSVLGATSAGCSGIARSTASPYVSTATTAYFTCQVSGVGAQSLQLVRTDTAAAIGAALPFTVAMPQVTMTLSNGAGVSGDVVIALAADKTPVTALNFLHYVNTGWYTNTVFHRETDPAVYGFGVLQGGGFTGPVSATDAPSLKAPTAADIPLEVHKGLSNLQWTVGMARTDDPDSANTQFYFNTIDNSASFDPTTSTSDDGYAVFGNIVSGTGVVQAAMSATCVASVVTNQLEAGCLPVPNIVITAAAQTQ